jgi:hypothetical protein
MSPDLSVTGAVVRFAPEPAVEHMSSTDQQLQRSSCAWEIAAAAAAASGEGEAGYNILLPTQGGATSSSTQLVSSRFKRNIL